MGPAALPERVVRTGLLGLGSNVGDRREHLQGAVLALPGAGVEVLACSSVYDTDPVGEVLDQASFLNACVLVRTDLQALELLDRMKALERELGRGRGRRHGPRSIDIDILLLGELELRDERMTLPHEQLLERRFVLVPALELELGLRTPAGESLAHALAALDVREGVRWAGPPLQAAPAEGAPAGAGATPASHSAGSAPGGTSPTSGGK
ncbi:MAG TPA: 2-amino-4-hydroxy-6-hydroxymethyldihydropteridine diphosphokinase [Solirubrobacteraceae bacterium]|nr:2-amino-4-hydroxy-6-hydroxymethyldihydropteridine diphosphokinase [Solirubrobacteraceae bacterium]